MRPPKFRSRSFRLEHLERREVLSGATWLVDDDGQQFPAAQFSSIQDAVDAASAGDRVVVAAGTYVETVTIGADKNGVRLQSEDRHAAVIKAPAGAKLAVHVDGANEVAIQGFTIYGATSVVAAVYVGGEDADGGSADISHNHVAVRDGTALTGAQTGLAILVGKVSALPDYPLGAAAATIHHNLVDNYQKGGVVVNGPAASAEIAHNQVVGTPATYTLGQAAQNGIQVSGGADASIHHNVVADNAYTPNPTGTQWAASGILVSGAGHVVIAHNVVTGGDSTGDNNVGIYVYATNGVQLSQNTVQGNDWGILLYDVENARVEQNNIQDSDVVGLALYEVLNSDLRSNRGRGNAFDFLDDADEGVNNWSKNKGELFYV
jgi:nitrous oxidase accessory protein NosD